MIIFVITVMFLAAFIFAQQMLRRTADERPRQLVSEMSLMFIQGVSPTILDTQVPVPIGESTEPYEIAFDKNGEPIAGNGELHGKWPHLPPGVFTHAQAIPEHRFTWQPEQGIREAVTLKYLTGDHPVVYVLAGQSLRPTETRVMKFGILIILSWMTTISLMLITAHFIKKREITRKKASA